MAPRRYVPTRIYRMPPGHYRNYHYAGGRPSHYARPVGYRGGGYREHGGGGYREHGGGWREHGGEHGGGGWRERGGEHGGEHGGGGGWRGGEHGGGHGRH
jgi:hypothetical protein